MVTEFGDAGEFNRTTSSYGWPSERLVAEDHIVRFAAQERQAPVCVLAHFLQRALSSPPPPLPFPLPILLREACKKHPEVTNSTVITEASLTNTFKGFVAYDASVDRIILSVAGTDPLKLKDWIDDLDFLKSTYPYCEEYGDEPCEVHEGFMATYECAKDVVRSTIKDYMVDHPTATVHVTGHSLGAIAAVFAAMDLTLTQDIPIASVITFGQPRGGDESFAKFLDQTIDEFR